MATPQTYMTVDHPLVHALHAPTDSVVYGKVAFGPRELEGVPAAKLPGDYPRRHAVHWHKDGQQLVRFESQVAKLHVIDHLPHFWSPASLNVEGLVFQNLSDPCKKVLDQIATDWQASAMDTAAREALAQKHAIVFGDLLFKELKDSLLDKLFAPDMECVAAFRARGTPNDNLRMLPNDPLGSVHTDGPPLALQTHAEKGAQEHAILQLKASIRQQFQRQLPHASDTELEEHSEAAFSNLSAGLRNGDFWWQDQDGSERKNPHRKPWSRMMVINAWTPLSELKRSFLGIADRRFGTMQHTLQMGVLDYLGTENEQERPTLHCTSFLRYVVRLFVQYDSLHGHLPGCFHASFQPCDKDGNVDSGWQSLPGRQSLESRWVVLWDYTPAFRKANLLPAPWQEQLLKDGQRVYYNPVAKVFTASRPGL